MRICKGCYEGYRFFGDATNATTNKHAAYRIRVTTCECETKLCAIAIRYKCIRLKILCWSFNIYLQFSIQFSVIYNATCEKFPY